MAGPLAGMKVIELAGIGPGPFCGMMLSDMGAEVVRIDRKTAAGRGSKHDVMARGRRSIAIDLKKPEATEALLRMVDQADVVMEGFRPGVVSVVQTFGDRVNFHPHVHALVTRGGGAMGSGGGEGVGPATRG